MAPRRSEIADERSSPCEKIRKVFPAERLLKFLPVDTKGHGLRVETSTLRTFIMLDHPRAPLLASAACGLPAGVDVVRLKCNSSRNRRSDVAAGRACIGYDRASERRVLLEAITLICDVCGKPAAETVTIKVGNKNHLKDFCSQHLSELLQNARTPKRGRPRVAGQ